MKWKELIGFYVGNLAEMSVSGWFSPLYIQKIQLAHHIQLTFSILHGVNPTTCSIGQWQFFTNAFSPCQLPNRKGSIMMETGLSIERMWSDAAKRSDMAADPACFDRDRNRFQYQIVDHSCDHRRHRYFSVLLPTAEVEMVSRPVQQPNAEPSIPSIRQEFKETRQHKNTSR